MVLDEQKMYIDHVDENTGREVRFCLNASHADTADFATNAANAENAEHAINADYAEDGHHAFYSEEATTAAHAGVSVFNASPVFDYEVVTP